MKNQPIAFISYSRKDSKIAIDIHRRLEKYVYPREWVSEENKPLDDTYLRPVFLDVTDLSVGDRDFSDEIKERLEAARYLIVVCSENSAQSDYVQREIDYFLDTHAQNASLIIAVYVDSIFHGMHPVIDEIVASRNCPIYVTGKGEAGHVGRKYCFYHIVEYLLKVDFDKLYNRYEAYKRRKQRIKRLWFYFIAFLVVAAIANGWHNENKRRIQEEARVEFEKAVFPFSLVGGYLNNFLIPTLKVLNETHKDVDMIVFMPFDSLDLDANYRYEKYISYLSRHYQNFSLSVETVKIPGRSRDASVQRAHFDDATGRLVYLDNINTVSAFKEVIDYKFDPKNPLLPNQTQSQLTNDYSKTFISEAAKRLGNYSRQVHFVLDTLQMQQILDSLMVK